MRLGFVNNGAAATTTPGFIIFPRRPDKPDWVSSPGSPTERSLPANVHSASCSKRRAFSGYAQQYELTVKQTAAHPRALSWDQNMEVSGADSFWPLCLGFSILMIHVQGENVFGLCFFILLAEQNSPVCGRLVESACVCQMEQMIAALVVSSYLACLFSSFFFSWHASPLTHSLKPWPHFVTCTNL